MVLVEADLQIFQKQNKILAEEAEATTLQGNNKE